LITYQGISKIFENGETFILRRHDDKSGLNFHSAVEIIYIKSGRLEVNLNGATFVASEGDIVVVNPTTLHGYSKVTNALDYYFLMISDEFLEQNNLYDKDSYFSPLVKSEKLNQIYQDIIDEYECKNERYETAINGLIISMFVMLNREYKTVKLDEFNRYNKTTQMVRLAIYYISEHYKEKINVCEIANNLHFSKSYLSHAFKEITGYSIIEYVNLLKCHNAKALLLDGHTASEVSNELGFSDLSYFTRIFKKVMGVTPSDVKKS